MGTKDSTPMLGEGRYDIDDILERLQPAADDPAGKPQRFALYNLVLSGGRADFNDLAVRKRHELRDLNLSMPFLSKLRSQRDIKIAPHLTFTLNGSRFDTAAEGTPFAQTRKTDATFRLSALDLQPYLGYLPARLASRDLAPARLFLGAPKTLPPDPHGHRVRSLIWRCRKNSENTRSALFLKRGCVQALRAVTPFFSLTVHLPYPSWPRVLAYRQHG
ncbi:MAG: DUF748 domain-containing protein [Polaromonas sp.]|uniref:DUF748 domain-containing protein n=1 Tax=Polaromonas sp. TaxID=1869339 RepID=UPI0027330D8C|nr:DUF748 domain-containing protein [Polaromonas sp.]MDP2819647.1 DUF748 domain-containing protein [Polaromonas sp.]